MISAAIYVRVSTAEQAEKGYSLATQLEACRQKAAELGIKTVKDFIDDGFSGEYLERPALLQLRDQINAKAFNTVIVYDPDRLARNLAHQLLITDEIEKSGAQLLFVSVTFEHSPEGKLFYSIRGAISAYEKEKIKERTQRGKRGKAAKGKIIADAKPFGYLFEKEISNYTINEPEAELVRKMYQWLIEDKVGTATICKRLNEMGVPSPRLKKPWIVSAVYRLLTNPIYKGTHVAMRYQYQKVAQNKRVKTARPESEWIEVPVPAIVDNDTWQAAQQQLKDNKTMSKRNLKHEQLLNGLVYCAKCGRKMTIAYAGKTSDPKSYYVCVSQRSNTYLYSDRERCDARRVPTELLDNVVYDHLNQLSQNPRSIKQYILTRPNPASINNINTSLERLKDHEVRLTKQRETILRWYRQQMIGAEDGEKQLEEIRTRLQDIEQNKQKLRTELASLSPVLSPAEIVATIQRHFESYEPTYEEKRTAIRQIIDKVVVERKDDTRARSSKPDIGIELKFL